MHVTPPISIQAAARSTAPFRANTNTVTAAAFPIPTIPVRLTSRFGARTSNRKGLRQTGEAQANSHCSAGALLSDKGNVVAVTEFLLAAKRQWRRCMVSAQQPGDHGRARRGSIMETAGMIVAIISFGVGAICALLMVRLVFVFSKSPTTPEPAHGNVVPWNNHGVYHYVQSVDYNLYSSLLSFAPIVIGFGLAGLFLCKGRRMFDR